MVASAPDLDEYRADAERYLTLPASGSADLFGAGAVAGLRVAADADPALRPLARFAAEGLLRAASADETDVVERLLGEPLVNGPEGPVALRDVDPALAREPDAERRRELQTARLRALSAHVAEPLADAVVRRDAAARALGAPDATALIAGAAAIDPRPAAAGAARLLDATDEAAARSLDLAARDGLGIPWSALDVADLPRLVSAPHLDADLPTTAVGPAVGRTRELLELTRGPVAPSTALERLAAFAEVLRATGAALARAGASPRLPAEARLLADPALAGAAGRLFEGLVGDPAWLARVVGTSEPDRVARTAAAVRLMGARACAARVASLGVADPEGMSRAVGVTWPAELSAGDPLAGLAPLDDLRARALAAALRTHLREAHGARWFADPRAGAFLRELWLEGGLLDAEDLARELGAPGLDPGAVAHEATTAPA